MSRSRNPKGYRLANGEYAKTRWFCAYAFIGKPSESCSSWDPHFNEKCGWLSPKDVKGLREVLKERNK